MPSQDKLIKQGIQYNDALFKEIIKRLEQGILTTDTLEAFLEATKEFTAKNPLISSGYNATMLRLILAETNNHRFSRPAQRELVRITIENYVGNLIVDIGEDIKETVRDVVKDGYNQGLSQYEIADNISKAVTTINNKRANVLARTEIARTATVSDYIINAERGATHFRVDCRGTCCEVCKHDYHWGDVEYPISRTDMLPPRHPNCRCVPYFYDKNNPNDVPDSLTNARQIQKELNELTEIAFNIDAGELPKSYMPDVMERIRYFRNKRV